MNKKIKIAVTWEMCGYIEVEANSTEEAIEKVKEDADNYSLPMEQHYVDGSFQPTTYDVEEMEAMCDL